MAVGTDITTADELLDLPDDGMRHELVDGEHRVTPPPGAEHGRISATVGALLFNHVRETDAGVTFAAETGFRLGGNTVLAPDAAFVSRLRADKTGRVDQYWPGAPDLAVEVVSPSERNSGLTAKVDRWLRSGSRVVLVLRPGPQTVTVHRPGVEPATLRGAEIVDLDDLIPGFRPVVAELFA